MGQGRINVICVDDHPVVRSGLIAILTASPEIQVVATGESGEEAVALYKEFQPDVLVIDLRLPGISGVEAVEAIRRDSPDARVVVLTTYAGDEDIYRALQAGATTYLLKDTVADELVRVVREVHGGARPIPQDIAASLASRIAQPGLTRREIEVLGWLANGSRNKEIAGELGISEETVQVHVKNILAKLNVHDRTEAVTTALRRGILHLR